MQALAKSERCIYQWTEFHAALLGLVIAVWETWSDLFRLSTTGLIWIPCSRCKNVQWAKNGWHFKQRLRQ
jgi:hypothetical protein